MRKFFFLFIASVFIMSSCEKPNAISTPKNVTASVTGNQLTLTWDKVKGVEQYHIFRKMEGYYGSSGQFLEMSENPITEVYSEDLGAPTGTTYTYQVVAEKTGSVGQEVFSDRATSNAVTH
jgi:hypothetical protein